MKAKQLAQLLDQVSAILKHLPDMELQTALSVISQNLQVSTIQDQVSVSSPTKIATNTPSTTSAFDNTSQTLENLPNLLDNVPTEHLESFIRSSIAWKYKPTLQKLAKILGIKFTTKLSKDELLILIVTHFETRRTHSLIRTYQPEHANL